MVNANGNQFKKYIVQYDDATKVDNDPAKIVNYQFVKNIKEFNANDEEANPINFSTKPLTTSFQEKPFVNFESVYLTGDYDGDGLVDSSDYQASSYTNFPPANYGNYIKSDAVILKEIDINSDGISEIIFSIFDKGYYKRQQPAPYEWVSIDLGYRYIIIDHDDFISNTLTKINTPTTTDLLESTYMMDFEKDGVQDILRIENPNFNNYAKTDVTFYTKNKYTNASIQRTVNVPVNVISQYTVRKVSSFGNNKYQLQLKQRHSIKGLRNEIKFGDLNGDGNVEILVPLEKNKSYDEHIAGWSFYLNNGKTLSEFCQGFVEYYDSIPIGNGTYEKSQNGVIDIDNDGKSDFLHFYTGYITQASGNYSNSFLFKMSEFKYDLNNTQFKWSWQMNTLIASHRGGTSLSPIFGDFRINNNIFKVIFLSQSLTNAGDKKLFSYQHYNLGNDKNINSITQGGIITEIDYRELDPAINLNLYAPVKTEVYPYVELDKVSQSYAVSQLRQKNITYFDLSTKTYKITDRKQDFRYRGMITHLQGKGMIGFRKTARSSWYTDDLVATKIWNGAEIDPLKDGVPIKEWSIKTNDETQVFPTDFSEINTQLLSLRSTEYRFDKLYNNRVSATIPIKSISEDFMKDVRTENTITYDVDDLNSTKYYLPIKTVSETNINFAVSTTNLSYIHNAAGSGNTYFIGRPATKEEKMEVYSDTKKSKEEYTYADNLLKTKKSYNRDNTGWFLETYKYDDFGNIIEKVITSSIDGNSKTDKAEYDDQGKFVMKKTDNHGLETLITYNKWGQIETQTDPLGNVLTNTYDNWGKLLKSKTNLSGYTTYSYEKTSLGDAVVTQYNPDGGQKISYTNKFGQNYKSTTKNFGQGKYVSAMIVYDAIGRKIGESEPFSSGLSATQWNFIYYDDYSRPIKATSFIGKVVETTYNDRGRTVTVTETNANNRFKKQTADPIGNIISSEDMGGIINFKFNAAGENIEANYEGNIVKTSYDAWGNKIRFEDPSNGVYEYEYKGYFGAISKTISPKGEKTYEYNNKGQLNEQKEKTKTGNGTDKVIIFAYNSKGLITGKSGTSSGKSFSSGITYDSFGRVLSSYEDSNGKYFMKKGITYDNMMRVTSYEKSLYSSGILTKVALENEYNSWNGELLKVKEKATGKVLWELQETNEKGQVTHAKLGGTAIENFYTNGFLGSIKHTRVSDNSTVLYVSYSFNLIKNELTNRFTGGVFNIT